MPKVNAYKNQNVLFEEAKHVRLLLYLPSMSKCDEMIQMVFRALCNLVKLEARLICGHSAFIVRLFAQL